MQKVVTLLVLLCAITIGSSFAQSNHPDSLVLRLDSLTGEVHQMKKINFSGYLQPQWQKAQNEGIDSYAGGNFEPNVDNRFVLRRGRLKMTYTSKPVLIIIQTEATEKSVSLRDAYGEFRFPDAFENLSLRMGLFKKPFGFEVLYSSEFRESPERARPIQTLLPVERDLGAMLAYRFGIAKLEAGFFNGTSINPEFDTPKDFVGRFSASKELDVLKISGGVSFYDGSIIQTTNKVFEVENGGFKLQDTTTALGAHSERQYTGADLQLSLTSAIGVTTLRAEVVTGNQPGAESASDSPRSASLPTRDTYIRPFNGGIFYFLQRIGKSGLQTVLKYDFYDPNTDVSGNAVTTEGDVKYSTWGFGLNYYWKNMTFMAYFDKVENETTSEIAKLNTDLDDDVLTLRIQFRF